MKIELDQKLKNRMGLEIELIYTDASGYDPCMLLGTDEYGVTILNWRKINIFIPWVRVKSISWSDNHEKE